VLRKFDFCGIQIHYGNKSDFISFFQEDSEGKCFVALHVGSLKHLASRAFVSIDGVNDVIFYIDGTSLELILKRWGCKEAQRLPVTDFGWDLLSVAKRKDWSVGIVGGSKEINTKTREILKNFGSDIKWNFDGYTERRKVFEANLDSPRLAFVGLGMPLELMYSLELLAKHPRCTVLTCGGWFGFVVGTERRAPRLFRAFGFEWLWRLMQNPKRLLPRYIEGFIYFFRFLLFDPRRFH